MSAAPNFRAADAARARIDEALDWPAARDLPEVASDKPDAFPFAALGPILGTAAAVIGEPFGIPLTAHFLGGCVIASDASRGVVDRHLRVFGVEGLHIFDGSTLSANPGVNPSLTIAAQAEWAASYWPAKTA